MTWSESMKPLRDMTIDQLISRMKEIQADPANQADGLSLYTKKAAKTLDLIGFAIKEKMAAGVIHENY